MVVVKICLWPKGDRTAERVLAVGSLTLIDQADGVRTYKARLFKDPAFGGPDGSGDLAGAPVWREGTITGHRPGARGGWDLLGGALRELLGSRLASYRTPGRRQ